MQFHKEIKSEKITGIDYDYNQLFKTESSGKIDFEKFIEKLLFVPHLHNSKSGIVNVFSKLTKERIDEIKAEINQLYSNEKITERLKNIFLNIPKSEDKLTKEEKEEIMKFHREKNISDELRDICLGIYDPSEVFPDIAASQIKMLYEKEYLSNRIIKEGMKCCRELVHDLGYSQLVICKNIVDDDDALKTIINEVGVKNVMIIPGCQEDGMLTGRVLKAVSLLGNFQGELTIIASGGNPTDADNPNKPKMYNKENESHFIKQTIDELIERLNIKKPETLKVITEGTSWNSYKNMANSLNNKLEKSNEHNFIVVSSTFHLMKLATAIEIVLQGILKNNDNKKFVRNIVLVGAEGVDADFSPQKSGGYIKSMFNEVYTELIKIHNKRK